MNKIILFDGECNFCDASVQFIINRDPNGVFAFASLQSEFGKQLLAEHNLSPDINSFVLITGQNAYLKSSAALHTAKQLKGLWKFAFLLLAVPRPIRDFVYDIIARNRYKWFGKKEQCIIPSAHIRKRFYM